MIASRIVESASDLFDGPINGDDLRVSQISRTRRVDPRRYSTGLENVNDSARLLRPGWLHIVGAREGQGKTSFAERLAMVNAMKHRVLFATLDMPRETLQDRILSKSMQVADEHVIELEKQKAEHFENAMRGIGDLDLMVWRPRKGKKSIDDIIERAVDVTAAILIIDYSRLIDGWDYGKKAADIVDTLADWTQEAMVHTILLTQLKDEAVNKRPHNGHLQDTTQIAQRADRITLIYRPYKGHPAKDTIAEIITSKNRGGPEVRNHVGYIGETMDFWPMVAEEEANAKCCRITK